MDQHWDAGLQDGFHALESLTNVLINAAVLGLYSLASLVLLPAVFATPGWPLRNGGMAAFAPGLATGPSSRIAGFTGLAAAQ